MPKLKVGKETKMSVYSELCFACPHCKKAIQISIKDCENNDKKESKRTLEEILGSRGYLTPIDLRTFVRNVEYSDRNIPLVFNLFGNQIDKKSGIISIIKNRYEQARLLDIAERSLKSNFGSHVNIDDVECIMETESDIDLSALLYENILIISTTDRIKSIRFVRSNTIVRNNSQSSSCAFSLSSNWDHKKFGDKGQLLLFQID